MSPGLIYSMTNIPDKYLHLFKKDITLEDTSNIPSPETTEDVLALLSALIYHLDTVGGFVDAVGAE